jgi:hypothetical protein
MEIFPRQRNVDNLRTPAEARAQAQAKSNRWDPAWNGRKNFKKFRRRGAEQGVAPHRVIVALEEAPSQRGFSDGFFLTPDEPRASGLATRRKKGGENEEVEEDSEPEQGFRGRKSRTQSQRQSQRQTQEAPEIINVEDSGPDDEEVVEPRTQKSSGRTQRVVETQSFDQGRKRPGGAASGQPPAKKGKVNRSMRDESDSDNEEKGFRFKRR